MQCLARVFAAVLTPSAAALHLATFALPAMCSAQAGAWSQSVAGVRGRLVIGPRDTVTRSQITIDLELENVSNISNNIGIWWSSLGDMLDFQLEDGRGTPVAKRSDFGDEMTPPPEWLILPYKSSMRVTRHPVGLGGEHFRLPGFQASDLSGQPAGTFCLRATFTPRPPQNFGDHNRPWVGHQLALPCAPIPWTGG